MPTIRQRVKVTVERAATVGYGEYVSFGDQLAQECDRCGALTLDAEKHDEWHNRVVVGESL